MIKQIFVYICIALFFGFISYQAVRIFRTSVSWRTFVVQSGSMEPSIMTGDVIVIQKKTEYQRNEVITFKDSHDRTVTHRITETTQPTSPQYTTKGDANQTIDTEPVPLGKVVGKVVLVVPKFGYIVQFIKSPWGFIITIIVPTALIMYDEIRSLITNLTATGRRRHKL